VKVSSSSVRSGATGPPILARLFVVLFRFFYSTVSNSRWNGVRRKEEEKRRRSRIELDERMSRSKTVDRRFFDWCRRRMITADPLSLHFSLFFFHFVSDLSSFSSPSAPLFSSSDLILNPHSRSPNRKWRRKESV